MSGKVLHDTVPPSCWCVNKQDLLDLRTMVERAVQDGQILPTNLDPFDPHDRVFGPCIHTVNEQLIKPHTSMAGNMSWALMKHPHGLQCDLFITHAWQEGFYELINKVLNSWPRHAKHAYCCVLSNPQNLNIAHLISEPQTSPFAEALRSAKWMLVVPNRKVSIYRRIWCSYEAFLAYKWNKSIFIASMPLPELPWQCFIAVLFTVCIMLITFTIVLSIWRLPGDFDEFDSLLTDRILEIFTLAAICRPAIFMCFICSAALRDAKRWMRAVNYMGCCMIGMTQGSGWAFLWHLHTLIGWVESEFNQYLVSQIKPMIKDNLFRFSYRFSVELVMFLALLSACEVDRICMIGQELETHQLHVGYTGRLTDAGSSVKEDGDRIRAEIKNSGEEQAADEAIHVLLAAGMSTHELRQVANQGVLLKGCAYIRYSFVVAGGCVWVDMALMYTFWKESSIERLCVTWGCIVLFAIAFACHPRDRKTFDLYVLSTLFVCCAAVPSMVTQSILFFFYGFAGSFPRAAVWLDHKLNLTIYYLLGPLTVVLSLAGPASVSRMPVFGRCLVQLIYAKTWAEHIRAFRSPTRHADRSASIELTCMS